MIAVDTKAQCVRATDQPASDGLASCFRKHGLDWKRVWGGCLRRIRAWRLPPHWSPGDWADEVFAQGISAAWQALGDFDPARNGLVPVQLEQWEQFVFVHLNPTAHSLRDYFGGFVERVASLDLARLRFIERRKYELRCNWKVFVDNYLDGGYHVPYVHQGLNSVLDYKQYSIETAGRGCLQSSPVESAAATEKDVGETRRGAASYFWFYPNFMLNWYEGVLDTNLVLPLGIDRTLVIFDFFFGPEFSDEAARQSVAVSERIQDEDVAICESVQRGIGSCAYRAGRLSVRREGGEHLFHRLLAQDLKRGFEAGAGEE